MSVLPQVTVEAALISDPLDASPTWTNVSTGLRTGKIKRGRSHELDRMQAGTCSLTFKNADDRWNPWNTVSPYYGNLLTANQSDVETDTTGFAAFSNCTLARTNAQANHGTYSLGVTTTAGGSDSLFKTTTGTGAIPIPAGATITGLMSFRTSLAVFRTCKAFLTWYTAAGASISDTTGAGVSAQQSVWTSASVTGTAPATAAFVSIGGLVSGAGTAEVNYADTLALMGGPTGLTWQVGGRGGNLQPMCKIRVRADWNLLSANQASVETDTTGLGFLSNCSIARSTSQAFDGAASLAVTTTTGGSDSVVTTTTGTGAVPVVAGEPITGMWNFKTATAVFRTVHVYLTWYNAAGSALSDSVGANATAQQSIWTQASIGAIAPAGAAFVALKAVVSGASTSEVTYVDGAAIFPMLNVTTWAPGGPQYLFTGFVESLEHAWPTNRYAETTVTAVDGFKVLSLAKAASTAFHDAQVADGVSALYRLSDAADGPTVSTGTSRVPTAAESIGGVLVGAINGNAEYGVTGALPSEANQAMGFGVGRLAYILISGAEPVGTTDWAIEGLVCPRRFPTVDFADRIWSEQVIGSQQVAIYLRPDGKLRFSAFDGTNGGNLDTSAGLTLNRWNHVVCSKIGTTGPGNWKIIINRVDVSTGATTSGTGNCSLTAYTSMIGGKDASSGGTSDVPAFDGLQDEFGIYSTNSLSVVQAQAHYDDTFGLFEEALTGARIGKLLDLVGWPAGERALDAGQFSMQPLNEALYNSSPLPLILDYVDSEGYPAAFFVAGDGKMTFHDNAHATPSSSGTFGDDSSTELNPRAGAGGSPPMRDDLDIWTTVVCQAKGGVPQQATDATAAGRYADRTLSRTNLRNASDADAATLAAALLARYKTPADRVKSLTIHPIGDPSNLYPHALGREIGDRITYNRHTFPGAGTNLSLDLRIEGIETEFRPGDWKTTWMLVPT